MPKQQIQTIGIENTQIWVTDFNVKEFEKLWASDITYISIIGGSSYLSLITGVYYRKIVGLCLYEALESIGCVIAPETALKNRKKDSCLIHHSDRGIQYFCHDYANILNQESIKISMTESCSPYDNAIAERVNGILKTEFGLDKTFNNYTEAKKVATNTTPIYNEKRPHSSCDYLTPEQAYGEFGELKK